MNDTVNDEVYFVLINYLIMNASHGFVLSIIFAEILPWIWVWSFFCFWVFIFGRDSKKSVNLF